MQMKPGLLLKPALVAALVAAALAGCSHSGKVESFGGPTMGSTYSIKYVTTESSPDAAVLQQGVEAILAEVDQQVSTYRPDSLIAQFNAAPAGTCQDMPPAVLDLVSRGEQLSVQSDGAYDMTLMPLLSVWGFGPGARSEHAPDAAAIEQARQQVGHQYLHVRDNQLCKDVALQVDFNSIAAGHAVDRIADWLLSQGISSYLVEATGEVKAAGHKPDGSSWRIAIEAPLSGERVAQKILALDGLGISTSGDYRNYYEEDGRRYSHTIDPRTAAPISHKLAAVTVVHPQATEADGLSTLLMVLGPEQGEAFARSHELAAFFVTRDGEEFVTHSTPAFDALFAREDKQ